MPRINQCLLDWFNSREFRVGSAGQGEAVPSRAGGAALCLPCCADASPRDAAHWGALVLGVHRQCPWEGVAACPGMGWRYPGLGV